MPRGATEAGVSESGNYASHRCLGGLSFSLLAQAPAAIPPDLRFEIASLQPSVRMAIGLLEIVADRRTPG
jgi:hypothetical protein